MAKRKNKAREKPAPVVTMDAFSNPAARLGFGTMDLTQATTYPMTRLTQNYELLTSQNDAEMWIRFGSGADNTIVYALYVEQYDPSLEDFGIANWKAHLAAHPLEVMTYLETPIETDLSDEEISAYKALHTYSPATTVSNDAGAWMKAGVQNK